MLNWTEGVEQILCLFLVAFCMFNELNCSHFSNKKTCRFVREQANLNIGMAGMLERIMRYCFTKVK